MSWNSPSPHRAGPGAFVALLLAVMLGQGHAAAQEEGASAEALRAAIARRHGQDAGTAAASHDEHQPAATPEAIWAEERLATEIALKHDFYPDGWDLGLEA